MYYLDKRFEGIDKSVLDNPLIEVMRNVFSVSRDQPPVVQAMLIGHRVPTPDGFIERHEFLELFKKRKNLESFQSTE